MSDEDQKIGGLKKVTLSLEAGTTENKIDLTSGPNPWELVVGTGTKGFTPFEYELLGKKVGDIIKLEIHTRGMGEMFGHMDIPLPQSARDFETFFLNARIDRIEDVDQAGLVRAMAGAVRDCGRDCCGHH